MRRYIHDVESVDLTNEEHAAFAHLVRYLCHLEEQRRVSSFLAENRQPQVHSVQDFAQRQARKMWRTEIRI